MFEMPWFLTVALLLAALGWSVGAVANDEAPPYATNWFK